MNTATETLSIEQEAMRVPLDQIDVSDPQRFADDTAWPWFARLRAEAPVHYCRSSPFGAYWSVTRFKDIQEVELHPEIYSSASRDGGITIMEQNTVGALPMFIAMDPPQHRDRRKAVAPIVSRENLVNFEEHIRRNTNRTLDELPVNEVFDWADKVSLELTSRMLATLFDVPDEDRRQLIHWGDVATTLPGAGLIDSEEERMQIVGGCAAYMTRLWNERVNVPPRNDLISMLAHAENAKSMTPEEFLGDVLLLIVGGNDTTRNSMTGSVIALNDFPEEYEKLCANPALVSSAAPEFIRWQTPVIHMRRKAMQDTELGGQRIAAGDKVIMWYISGNRDADVIDNPDALVIDRQNPRQHLSFGYGIHHCLGNRLGDMQLKILWEELLKRWPKPGQIEVAGPPKRIISNFLRGYTSLPVRIRT